VETKSEAANTAASSFDLSDVDLSNPASYFDQVPEATEAPPPPSFKESEDGFFNQVQDGLEGEEAPAEEATEEPVSEGENVEDAEISEPTDSEQTAADEVSIDAFKKEHKFKLDPEDADLRRTLRNGVKFKKGKADLNKVKSELEALQAPEVQEKIQVWDELKSYVADGDYDKVFQSILGDAYGSFLEQKLSDKLEYEEADPARRAEMDMDRYKREQSYKERQWEREREEIRAKEQSRQDTATLDKWEGYGVPALDKYGFNESEVSDADRRYQLNQHLWESTWTAIENYAKGDESKITPNLVAKAFQKKANLLKYGTTKPAEKRVEEVTEQKKQEAAVTAASVATANYPKPAVNSGVVNDWMKGSGGARDLLNLLRKG